MMNQVLRRMNSLTVAAAMLCVCFAALPVLSANELPADTNQISSLTPEQACHVLLANKADALALNGLTSLSVDTAQQLKEFSGACIQLDGLKTLSPEVAVELTHYVGYLSLDGLEELPDDTASQLGVTGGQRTWLPLSMGPNADDRVSAAIASANARRGLSLNGLASISDKAANALGGSRFNALSLNGLETIPPSAIAALGRFKGHVLSLGGLKTLDPEAATTLSAFHGQLYLDGLSTLDASTAKALANFHGKLLSLKGLDSLPLEAAEILGRNPSIRLPEKFSAADSESSPVASNCEATKARLPLDVLFSTSVRDPKPTRNAEPGVGADSR